MADPDVGGYGASSYLQKLANTKLDSIITALPQSVVWGIGGVPFTSADQHSAVASVTDAPTAGQKLVIDGILVSVDTAMNVIFKIETAGTVIYGPFYIPVNGFIQFAPRGKGRKLATADKKLQVITSVSGNIMVDVSYHSEA